MPEKHIVTLDSSQITAFLECPTLWYYGYKRRLTPNNGRVNTPMDMGTYGHKLLEIIYKERSIGTKESTAIDKAFAYNIDSETCRCSHGAEHHNRIAGTLEFSMCESIGCPCKGFSPVYFPLSSEDRSFVRDRVLTYTTIEGSAIPELRAPSPDYVEVGFSEKIYEDDERIYVLEGRIDLLGQIANNVTEGWADHKFQMRERNLYKKSIQFRNYSMVTKRAFGVINYIRFAQKIEKDHTFKRDILSFSRLEMDAWKDRLIDIYRKIETVIYQEPRNWYFDTSLKNPAACSGKYGYPCDYVSLCENWMNPALVQIQEQNDFTVKAEWRPW